MGRATTRPRPDWKTATPCQPDSGRTCAAAEPAPVSAAVEEDETGGMSGGKENGERMDESMNRSSKCEKISIDEKKSRMRNKE